MTTPPWKVVTPREYRDGWYELNGMTATRRDYIMLGRTPDGDYVVRNPELQMLEEEKPIRGVTE